MDSESLIQEWMRIDPFILDLQGFQKFCDIRYAGHKYPLNYEEIFQTVETIRAPFLGCARDLIGTAVGTCTPQESAEDYWKRNNIAAETIRAVVALKTKKREDSWLLHLNDSEKHLKWIESEFGFALSEKDFDDSWALWEHKCWFQGDNGYYVKGWMAVADGLGIGGQARDVLEKTPFPHADTPNIDGEKLCEKMNVCPIYQFREWLRITSIDIPGKVFRHPTFRSNLDYHLHLAPPGGVLRRHEAIEGVNSERVDFRVKWNVHKWIREYLSFPQCKKCGEISYWSWRTGCDIDLEERKRFEGLELCYNCIRIVEKTYTTKINPLKTENVTWAIPQEEERELRRRFIEGDVIFDGVKVGK